jgi:hypothetical protein
LQQTSFPKWALSKWRLKVLFWMEPLVDVKLVDERRLKDLMVETHEILKIIVSPIKTAKDTMRNAERKA